ncbi:MAG: LD-carboxypeptidase [Proteobacteria bacterium]|nr:LD-carboxypeptidase [Pseudomonadota bacterium]
MPEKSFPAFGPTRRAPALQDGDAVGVVAPARWVEAAEIEGAPAALLGDRFAIRLAPQLALRLHQFAGSDADRARGLEAMFADPAIKAIVCAKGGYGSPRIVDALDYELIARNPKRFVGYSDITALLLGIAQHAGLETYHGPMLADVATGLDETTRAHLMATLTDTPAPAAAETLLMRATVLRAGRAEGRLIGGNLTLLANMIGTRTDFDTTGTIFFLEDVDEPLYNLDRMLVHLKRAGKFAAIAALVIGELRDIGDGAVPFGVTVEQMALELVGDAAIPIVANFPCGHTPYQLTLPIGASARLECTAGRISRFDVL